MNALRARLRAFLAGRAPRERWLLALAASALGAIVFDLALVRPVAARADAAEARAAQLEGDLARALRIASEVRLLQGQLAGVEARIRPGERTNLLSELEKLAAAASLGAGQLASITERGASANPRYPETRVEVTLQGATLEQVADYLYRIENAPILLIVRTLRLRARGGDQVDAEFSVSTFRRT